jgi:hypothetical protein
MRRELESAFRRTRYRVFAPDGELVLRVDEPAPAMAALLRACMAREAALLTAFNPQGQRQPAFRNRQAQRALRAALLQQGCLVIEGRNEDPRGLWPAEPSLLVLGMSLARAQELALRHGQAAFLWMDAAGTPRLIEAAAAASKLSPCGFPPRPRRCCPTPPAA